MNKGMIISYFDKVSKSGFVSSSATQLALKLEVHRNTISNRLTAGYYEDDTCLMFCIDRQDFIYRSRDKVAPANPIDKRIIKPKIVQPVRVIAQQPAKLPNVNKAFSSMFADVRNEPPG